MISYNGMRTKPSHAVGLRLTFAQYRRLGYYTHPSTEVLASPAVTLQYRGVAYPMNAALTEQTPAAIALTSLSPLLA
jgi:hypothetical protein